MAGIQGLLAIAMAFSLARVPNGAKGDALGTIVQANRANLSSQRVSEGTTIYNGDRLTTEAGGFLQVQIGEAILNLPEQSCVIVHKEPGETANGLDAELIAGTVVLSATPGVVAEIAASSARVRPISDTRGVVQVQLIKQNELIVFARRGSAQISYHGETETIAEGKMYRVLLNPPEDGAAGEGSPKRSGKPNKALVLIAIGAAGGVVAGITMMSGGGARSVESPDRP